MYCISCFTLTDLLFYHIDHIDYYGDILLYRSHEVIDGILYLTFQSTSDFSFFRFSCTSEDKILFDLELV